MTGMPGIAGTVCSPAVPGATGATGVGGTGICGKGPAVGGDIIDCAGGSAPVAATGKGGISSTTAGVPRTGPMAALRRLTDCSTRSPSIAAPTR